MAQANHEAGAIMAASGHHLSGISAGIAFVAVPFSLGLAVTALLSIGQLSSRWLTEFMPGTMSNREYVASAHEVDCGAERQRVKTLSDPDAARVNHHPVRITVRELLKLERPESLPPNIDDHRIAPVELTKYVVRAVAVQMVPEGSETRLIVADPNDLKSTMVTEFVYWGCAGSAQSDIFKSAFSGLHSLYGDKVSAEMTIVGETFRLVDWYPNIPATTGRQHLPPPGGPPADLIKSALIEIAGVGFFAQSDDQKPGAAPNGIELHPVLSVRHIP